MLQPGAVSRPTSSMASTRDKASREQGIRREIVYIQDQVGERESLAGAGEVLLAGVRADWGG